MSEIKPLPDSGTLCWCLAKGCDEFFRAWPPENYCPKHRKPRVRPVVDAAGVVRYVLEGELDA